MLPELKRVDNYDEAEKNNYYIFSANGYPSIIYNHLPNAAEDINAHGKYNYFIVCLDADEVSVNERKQEINDFVQDKKIQLILGDTQLITIIQNCCIETWFLGNRKIYTKNPQDKSLLAYTRYYDVSENCPELMGKYQDFNMHSQFHEAYLKELFKAKNINYSKKLPGDVTQLYYLQQLIARIENESDHLPTFREFIQFCNIIKLKLSN